MKIISHRGFWRQTSEKNQIEAFRHTVDQGFGTETDVRDALGRLVISHDPASGAEIGIEQVLHLFSGSGLTLALNIKADGLVPLLEAALRGHDLDWFAFDMSIPETLRYAKAGLPFYTRHSDIEPHPVLYESAKGVWLDSFGEDWFDRAVVARHLDAGKQVCVVSSELHGRDHAALWATLEPLKHRAGLCLCSDVPDQARDAFAP